MIYRSAAGFSFYEIDYPQYILWQKALGITLKTVMIRQYDSVMSYEQAEAIVIMSFLVYGIDLD